MAPKKGKKVINQDELRRLMKMKQRQTTDKKRVESPFAKYNSLDHLSCVLCGVPVKSDLLWQAHVLGKQHKEKVSELKGQKQTPQNQPLKRKARDPEDGSNGKKVKPAPGAGQSGSGPPGEETGAAVKSAGLSLLAGVYEEEEDEDEVPGPVGSTSDPPQQGEPAAAGLPADFFDSSVPPAPAASHSGSILKADELPEKSTGGRDNTAEALPEGFFDDPVRDAKVRNVDAPKDLLDKEWDEFQKEMRQVNTKSDAMVAEDDEEGRFERQLDEIDEQIECYRRVEVLRDKRDVVKKQPLQDQIQEHAGAGAGVEEEEDEELLDVLSRDWRAKGALA